MQSPLKDEMGLRRLISAAEAAPSIHNTQPWRFRVTGDDLIELRGDPDRMLWVADPRGHALHLSCGAALYNLRLAIRMAGLKPLVWALPDPAHEPTLLAVVQLAEGRSATVAEQELFEAIPARHTNRAPFADRPVPDPVRAELERAASLEYAAFRTLNRAQTMQVLDLVAEVERVLACDPVHLSEMRQWISANAAGDGVPPHVLGPRPDTEPAPVRDLGSGRPEPGRPVDHFEGRPQLAILSTAQDQPADWLRAGQALQRVLLTATWHGVAASFLYQPIELHEMRMTGGWWPWQEHPQMIIRLGYGPPAAGTARRPFTDILETP
ncbi:MAG TPA: hypothetical protein VLW50_15865 [Streptosporangiaceae bacterium]|nr:hypothetical protein [Streptosporangiaceae bacterium]